MAGRHQPIPRISDQPLTVDFIDNHLHEYHEAFRSDLVRYDPDLGHYVAMTPRSPQTQPAIEEASRASEPRKLQPAIEAMKFWSFIFDDSMNRFILKNAIEPEHRKKEYDYRIRDRKNWQEIYAQLQKAREAYDGKTGFWGRVKKGLRKVADKSDTTQQIVKFVPENEYVSPVLAVVEVLVDAIEKGAEVRENVKKKFDEKTLEEAFGNIEIFFSLFPEDEVIRESSIDLVVSMLKGIEDAIGFFISKQMARAGAAVLHGDGYQKGLLESINEMDESSQKLLAVAETSYMNSTSQSLSAIFTRTSNISWTLKSLDGSVNYVIEKVDFIFEVGNKILESQEIMLQNQELSRAENAQSHADIYNMFEKLVSDGEKNARERRIAEEKNARERRIAEEKNARERRIMEEKNAAERRIIEENLAKQNAVLEEQNELLKHNKEEIEHLREEVQRAHTPTPFQQQPQWASPPGQIPQYPYNNNPYLQPIWPPPPQQPYPPYAPPQTQLQHASSTNTDTLRELLHIRDFDASDIRTIVESRALIPLSLSSRSEQLATTPQFKSWLVKPTSRKLLIHGNFKSGPSLISPLSLLTATLIQVLRTRESYISLVFFCGSHVERDEGPVGGRAMIRSLIAQLLNQHSFDISTLSQEVDLDHVEKGSTKALCTLLSWLLRKVSKDMTIVILLDGVSHYEIDDPGFEKVMLSVIKLLLNFAKEGGGLMATLKLIVTSPLATDRVFETFETFNDGQEETEDESFIDMEELRAIGPQLGLLSLERGLDHKDAEDSD